MHFEKSLSGCIGEKQVRTVAREGGGYGGKESRMEIKISEGVLMGWRRRERLWSMVSCLSTRALGKSLMLCLVWVRGRGVAC